MIDFDDVHRRYWRDQRGKPRPEIPVRGGDLIERDGRQYAVLFNAEKEVVATYEIVGSLLCRRFQIPPKKETGK